MIRPTEKGLLTDVGIIHLPIGLTGGSVACSPRNVVPPSPGAHRYYAQEHGLLIASGLLEALVNQHGGREGDDIVPVSEIEVRIEKVKCLGRWRQYLLRECA